MRFFGNLKVLPQWLPLILLATLAVNRQAQADSMTLTETWSETSVSKATDNGTFSATLTVPGLSSFTSNTWASAFILLNTANLNTGTFVDNMQDANTNLYGPGSVCTATSATFYLQLTDTNGNQVNAFKLMFSRSGEPAVLSSRTREQVRVVGTGAWRLASLPAALLPAPVPPR